MMATAQDLWEAARDLLLAGEPAEAEKLLRQGPSDGPFSLMLGFALDAQGRLDEAVDAFARARTHMADDPTPAILEARCLGRLGRTAEARDAFAAATRKFDQSIELAGEFGAFELDQGAPGRAIEILGRALTQDDQRGDIRHNLGLAYARLGDLRDAAVHLESAYHLAPGPETSDAWAGILRDQGITHDAQAVLVERRRLYGLSPASAALAASILAEAGDDHGSAEEIARLVAFHPDHGRALSDLGIALDGIGARSATWHRYAVALGDSQSAPAHRLASTTPARTEEIVQICALETLGRPVADPFPFARLTDMGPADIYADQFYVRDDSMVSGDLVTTMPASGGDLVLASNGAHQALIRLTAINSTIDRAILWGGTANYYHWLMDDLPRLPAVLAGPPDWPIVLNASLAFQLESLAHLGVDLSRVRPLGALTRHHVRHLMVTHHPHLPRKPDGLLNVDHQAPDPSALAWLRDRFASWRKGTGPKRLFISRGAAQFRRIENEGEIEAVLAKRGFTSVRLEDLTLAEQIGLFSGLEAVVGAHGAGFTNLAFAPPGTKVVELHPPGALPLYFTQMCHSLDHSHAAIPGIAVRALNPLKRAFWHFTIDPLTVHAQLDAMGL